MYSTSKLILMQDEYDNVSPLMMFVIICVSVFVSYHHQGELDEYGRDSYDRDNGISGRDSWGNIITNDGSYSLWDNLIDTNPYY